MEQVIRAIKDINQTDVVVAAVSAVACLALALYWSCRYGQCLSAGHGIWPLEQMAR